MLKEVYIDKSDKQLSDFISFVKTNGKSVLYKRGDILIRESESSNLFFYIKSGVLKSYRWVHDREYILGFTFTGDLDCNPGALLGKSKSSYSIAAVTDCEIIKFNMIDFKGQYKSSEPLENMVNRILLEYIKTLEYRMFDAISLTAEERYKKLLNEQPVLFQQIPLTNIASFLGITKERLSRIRKKER